MAYYICGGYHDSGPTVCDGLRIPQSYLDDAVLNGIQKRLDQLLDRERLTQRLSELLATTESAAEPVPLLEAQLAQVRRNIRNLIDALAAGTEDLPSVRSELAGLERERAGLEEQNRAQHPSPQIPGGPRALAAQLVRQLQPLHALLETGAREERRGVVPEFLAGIRIEKAARQAVFRWFRLPRDLSLKVVELRGIEPLTPRLPASCSPS